MNYYPGEFKLIMNKKETHDYNPDLHEGEDINFLPADHVT